MEQPDFLGSPEKPGRSLEEELTGRHAAKLLGVPIPLGWSLCCAIVSFCCLCATSFIQYHLPYSSYPDSVDLIKCGMFWSLSWIMSQFLAIKDPQNRIIIGGPDGPRPARRRWRLLMVDPELAPSPMEEGMGFIGPLGLWRGVNQIPRKDDAQQGRSRLFLEAKVMDQVTNR